MQKGFYLDLTRCTSCYACVVACKAHHANSEEGVFRRRVLTLESGVFPEVRLANLSLSCMHCATPACRDVCPMNAIQKRSEDGLVLVDPNLCIGCKMCFVACPFGIPQFGKKGKMEKCDFCVERLEEGRNPACVDVCPSRALHAGPMDQLSSLASKKTIKRLVRSTDPSFFI
jgi:anaerobic dimethyl sulfoxide reductase subunit B